MCWHVSVLHILPCSAALLASCSPLYVCRKLLVSPCSTRWIVSSKYQKHRSTLNLQGTYVCHLHRHVHTQQHHVRITSVYFCVLLAFSLMHWLFFGNEWMGNDTKQFHLSSVLPFLPSQSTVAAGTRELSVDWLVHPSTARLPQWVCIRSRHCWAGV